jgi:hypothetical protein
MPGRGIGFVDDLDFEYILQSILENAAQVIEAGADHR